MNIIDLLFRMLFRFYIIYLFLYLFIFYHFYIFHNSNFYPSHQYICFVGKEISIVVIQKSKCTLYLTRYISFEVYLNLLVINFYLSKMRIIVYVFGYASDFYFSTCFLMGFPCGSAGKESFSNVGDLGSILGLGRSPG